MVVRPLLLTVVGGVVMQTIPLIVVGVQVYLAPALNRSLGVALTAHSIISMPGAPAVSIFCVLRLTRPQY